MSDGPSFNYAKSGIFAKFRHRNFFFEPGFSMKSNWVLDCMTLDRYALAYVRMAQGRKWMSMPSKPRRKGITELQTTSTQAETREVSVGNAARDEEIRSRAYEIYRDRGEQPGHNPGDWLQAEGELKRGMLLNPECGSATADIDTIRLLNCHDLGDC
jgi:hypothetical protein